MKKILSIFLFLVTMLAVQAENFPDLKYKNIGNKDKISYDFQTGNWSTKIDKKNGNYFIKTKGFGNFYDYLDSEKNFAFSTNCEYEFIYQNELIGYSNRDLKFYSIAYQNGALSKKELSKEQIEEMFPNYKVVAISEFSEKTNSLKIKKNFGDLKIILYNDTEKTFDYFTFSSGNVKFKKYDLRGFLTVQDSGMVQFARDGEHDYKNWYILLIR